MSAPENARTEKTLKEIGRLLETGDTDAMYLGAGDLLAEILSEFATALSTLASEPKFGRELMIRSIGCKAHEKWKAILILVRANHSQSAVSLIRPMTEELIYAKSLSLLPKADADEYLTVKTQVEIAEKIVAQHQFFPAIAAQFEFSNLPPLSVNVDFVEKTKESIKAAKDHLKEMM